MFKLKRVLYLLVVLPMILSTFASCGTKSSVEDSKSKDEPYTVNFVYHAPKEGNQAEVNEAINKITLEELNMKVNLIPMSFDTYNQKMPILLASKEPMDISFLFTWNYASFLDAGYIVNAADYKDYTKDIYKTLGEDAEAGYIGDTLLGFPMNNSRSMPSGIFVRKDIFDELGYKESDFNVTTDDYSSFDQLTQMFAKIKEKYPTITPFDGHRTMGVNYSSYVDGFGDTFGVLENYGQEMKVTNWFESNQYKQFALLNRKWFTSGYTSKDIAVQQELGQVKMKAGSCASFFASYGPNWRTDVKSQTGYDTVLIPVSSKLKSTSVVNGCLNSVMYQSQNKEKAFEFLNWAYTNADFNNILNWGIEGRDWVLNADGQAEYPEGITAQNVKYHEDFGFIYPNQYLMYPWTGSPKNIWDLTKNFDSDAIISKAFGFSFDPASVANEVQQCNTVLAKYESSICYGAVDSEKGLTDMNKELYDAGLQKIIDEKQRQMDEWMVKKK